MQADGDGNVLHMDPHEVAAYELYRAHVDAGGRNRDNLPYSAEMTQLAHQFNTATGLNWTEGEVWLEIKRVTKYGEGHIQDYLASHASGQP